ncbi:hypothetical protein L218DRAFT_763845 [Marasmius fiardii PR-910]|nr:hypothetical protein L218DRAFT_763845 [Marasmius fiardii PR-910]
MQTFSENTLGTSPSNLNLTTTRLVLMDSQLGSRMPLYRTCGVSTPVRAKTLAQSSTSGTPTPPVQSVFTAATIQSNHVAAPTTGNVFQPIELTSAFSTPEPSQNNSSINFFNLPDVNLGNFFGDGAPIASGSGATSTSGTSGASIGLEEQGVDVNRDVDDEREEELAGKDAGNGNPMQLDG